MISYDDLLARYQGAFDYARAVAGPFEAVSYSDCTCAWYGMDAGGEGEGVCEVFY